MSVLGLSSHEAAKRLRMHGRNELPRKRPPSIFTIFIKQFLSPLLIILIIAGTITLFVGEYLDSAVIFAAVLLNGLLGFFQEHKAIKTLHALSQVLNSEAVVIRDGKRITIDVALLVPGDVAILEQGQKVPADGVVILAEDLQVNEAVLTGESVPVQKHALGDLSKNPQSAYEVYAPHKDLSHSVYMGTTVFSGFGRLLVVQTGRNTAIGTLATDLSSIQQQETPLQKKLNKLTIWLTAIILVIIVAVMVTGVAKGHDLRMLMLLAVALAVSAIPEGLALVLTSILSLGMMRIFKKHGLVRTLVAAETLGSVDIICTDKTGTLTYGELQLVDVIAKTEDKQILYRALTITTDLRDPLEHEMKKWIEKKGLSFDGIRNRHPRVSHLPFTLENRLTASQTARHLFAFGAPEILLERSKISSEEKKHVISLLEEYGGKGYRLVAVAGKEQRALASLTIENVKQLNWFGFLVYRDQERQDIKASLRRAREAGTRIKVITGDYAQTTKGLLERLNWFVTDDQIATGEQLSKATTPNAFRKIVERAEVFARVTPQQKYKIVDALQKNGHVVAMMGDGVNDALALRKADISIVVRSASDVAKEIADLVLLNSNFSTVVSAIEEGRAILSQLQKVVLYLLSNSFTEVVLVFATLLFNFPIPLTAVQILWINIITDGPPSFALMFEKKDKWALKNGPKKKDDPILSLPATIFAGIVSLFTGSVSFALFLYFLETDGLVVARTATFFLVAIFSLFYVFSVRTLLVPIWKSSVFSNKPLIFTVIGTLIFQGIIMLSPASHEILDITTLSIRHFGIVLGVSVFVLASVETIKLGIRTLQTHPLQAS